MGPSDFPDPESSGAMASRTLPRMEMVVLLLRDAAKQAGISEPVAAGCHAPSAQAQ